MAKGRTKMPARISGISSKFTNGAVPHEEPRIPIPTPISAVGAKTATNRVRLCHDFTADRYAPERL